MSYFDEYEKGLNYTDSQNKRKEIFLETIKKINEEGKDLQGIDWSYEAGCDNPIMDFIWNELFGFCGCYQPEEGFKLVREVMNAINDTTNDRNCMSSYDMRNGSVEKVFIMYWLDEREITEHGGSIPGWLTPYGKELLHVMNEIELEEE